MRRTAEWAIAIVLVGGLLAGTYARADVSANAGSISGSASQSGSASIAGSNSGGNVQSLGVSVAPVSQSVGQTVGPNTFTGGATSNSFASAPVSQSTGANSLSTGQTSLQTGSTSLQTGTTLSTNPSTTLNINSAAPLERQVQVVENKDYTIRNVPAFGLGTVYPTAPCMGSSQVGGAGVGFSIGIGTSWTDDECGIRETARSFQALGLKDDAIAVICASKYAAVAPACVARQQ